MCIRDAAGASRQLVRAHAQAGISLIELIMFIVIVSVGVAGILSVLNVTTQKSTDPQLRKQMLAAAEALLEEVQLKPFTFCDPDDPNAATANSATDCTGSAGGANDESKLPLGPEASAGDTSRAAFDNVSDYNGLTLPTVTDINGGILNGYSARIIVTREQLDAGIPLDASLRITVTVTRAGSDSLSLSGYRLRYAPRSLP